MTKSSHSRTVKNLLNEYCWMHESYNLVLQSGTMHGS